MLYLSLYNGISSLEIGVDEGAVIEAPSIDSPRSDRPIVMYGTSILQGGCASRPGMAFTAILGRKLDREIINLGFSGNAWLDYEIAEYITRAQNPALIVLDGCTMLRFLEQFESAMYIRPACPSQQGILLTGDWSSRLCILGYIRAFRREWRRG